MSAAYLCIHGHFYQPPREDPLTGQMPRELAAAPYHDFNAKIAAECYGPNARHGNFGRMSFDLGPTLAAWLERHAPETMQRIQAAERQHRQAHGASNALAQPYNHTILPLASAQEKRVQIAWGIDDYRHRFGCSPEGMWLPETAADLATLRGLADAGIRYTILAPWQAADPIDPSEPYWIELGKGKRIAAFFYQGALSGSVSFDAALTTNADQFASLCLPGYCNKEKQARGETQLVLVASDGELYGHHQPWRDLFLARLLTASAPESGWEVATLGTYLRRHPPTKATPLRDNTSWSCAHGVGRWSTGCACTEGDSSWKAALRRALDELAAALDAQYEQCAGRLLADPWAALEDYLPVRRGTEELAAFVERHGGRQDQAAAIRRWLELQYCRQVMFTSCGFFFEDLDRIEPAIVIGAAARALQLLPAGPRRRLEARFVTALRAAQSGRTGPTGADLYAEALTPVAFSRSQQRVFDPIAPRAPAAVA